MQLVFIRHGQPEWIRDGLAIDDPGLTTVGRLQAELVGRRFRSGQIGGAADENIGAQIGPVDRLLVSPLCRARETAEPLAEALDLKVEVCDWLAEIASPAWEGAPAEYVERVFKEHRDKPVDEHWAGLEGGESFRDFHRRVTHGLQSFLDDNGNARVHDDPALWALDAPDRVVVIVAHGGTNASLIGYLLGLTPTPWEWERFVSFHASISEIQPIEISGRHAYSLYRFADVSHLPPGLQTR